MSFKFFYALRPSFEFADSQSLGMVGSSPMPEISFEVNGIIVSDQELPFPVRASTPGRPNGIRSDHGTVDSDEPT